MGVMRTLPLIVLALFCASSAFAQEAAPLWRTAPILSSQSMAILGVPGMLDLFIDKKKKKDLNAGPAMSIGDFTAGAVGYSKEVHSSDASYESAKYSALSSKLAMGPKIDLRQAAGRGALASLTVVQPPKFNRSEFSASMRQPIIDMVGISEMLRKRELMYSAAVDSDATKLRVSSEAVSAFFELARSRAVILFAEDYEKGLSKLLEYMKLRASAGAVSPADLDRVSARVENAKAKLGEARGGYASALVVLKRQLGEVPAGLVLPVNGTLAVPEDEAAALTEALQENHDLRSARYQMAAIGEELRSATSRFIPRVDVEWARSRNENGSATAEPTFSRESKMTINATVNLFSSGADMTDREAIRLRREALRLRIEHAERKLREDIEVTYASIDAVGERIEPALKEYEANVRVVAAFDEQLFLGGRTLLDVLDAYQRLYESRVYAFQLLTADAQQKYVLLKLLGRLNAVRSSGS